jgi:cytochrome b-561
MDRVDRLRGLYGWVDDRLNLAEARTFLGKAFPAEDSFLLGEVALFCFLLLVFSGVFLGFFFEPSISEVEYEGSVAEYQGEELPESFVSVLNITYDVPFGMLIRRMHHWAAHLMIASMALHMLRVFFTGAYRNPREPNWLIGTGLAGATMFAAYTGYALPFDEFASTAVGIGYNVALSIPLVGETIAHLAFGGSFPSSATIPRFYFLHVLVLPAVIAGLIGLHMLVLVRQKHTEARRDEDVPGPARDGGTAADGGSVAREDDSVVVGLPAVPNQVAVSAVVFFLTLATLSLLAGFLPVHNIAEYGPNDPASTPSLIMPDWFLMWGYGFLKLTPSWVSFDVLGVHISAEFVGGLALPSVVFGLVALWPFLDYEDEAVHFTADPLDRPVQTGVGVTGVVFILLASVAGMDVIVADVVGTTTARLKPYLIGSLVVGPVLAGLIVYGALGGVGGDDPPNGGASVADGSPDEGASVADGSPDEGRPDDGTPPEEDDE